MSYDWIVPIPRQNKTNCLLKVIAFDDSGIKVGMDKSDDIFTIQVVRLILPNGGETIQSGTGFTIFWYVNKTIRPVAKTVIKYTTNGSTWKKIKALSGNPGSYLWTVPNISSTKCKVKVILKDANGANVGTDVSDNVFTIQP